MNESYKKSILSLLTITLRVKRGKVISKGTKGHQNIKWFNCGKRGHLKRGCRQCIPWNNIYSAVHTNRRLQASDIWRRCGNAWPMNGEQKEKNKATCYRQKTPWGASHSPPNQTWSSHFQSLRRTNLPEELENLISVTKKPQNIWVIFSQTYINDQRTKPRVQTKKVIMKGLSVTAAEVAIITQESWQPNWPL